MNDKKVMLVAGQSGSKSTFAGGLLQHVQKQPRLRIVDSVIGDRRDYTKHLKEFMFSKGLYPDQTRNGYIVDYQISGESFARPSTNLSILDIPGEKQKIGFQPKGKTRLMLRLQKGQVPDRSTIISKYKNNIEDDFEKGNPPSGGSSAQDDWETAILYHLYTADSVIFLLNVHKVIEQDENLAYDKDVLEWAQKNFTDVAVVPTAVDMINYDPESYDPGLLERILKSFLTPTISDDELFDALSQHIGMGVSQEARNVIEYADATAEVDFFSVSVPDQNRTTGNLTDDGSGGFVVKGFDRVIKWLER
ncbi:MAG: hypothetical protein ABEJ73_02725 [Haloplanus sp.]